MEVVEVDFFLVDMGIIFLDYSRRFCIMATMNGCSFFYDVGVVLIKT